MPLEANLVYLEEELKLSLERLKSMKLFLEANLQVSVYRRAIRGNAYYYKKYWKDGKSVSEFLCRNSDKSRAWIEEIEAANKKRERVKEQVRALQVSIKALRKQLDIVRHAYKNSQP